MNKSSRTEFKSIFQELYPDLVSTALFYVHDLPTAEDITQEIFAKLWEKQATLSTIDNLKGYLQYAVKNKCLNHLEHQQVVDKYQQEYLYQTREDNFQTDEYIRLIQQLLEQLPPKRKQILELSVVESKSYQEIAVQLDISVNTVKDHIKKAYAFLREKAQTEVSSYILYLAICKTYKN